MRYSDSVRVRISADSDDEFHAFVELLKASGATLRPYNYVRYGRRHLMRLEVRSLPIPESQNPAEVD